ncbi:hypothetical protein [Paracholeplasma manati]|uniref:Uncharacterized protein n=1 Tax=Paracholeplasma manati TaxID=591373 RepID=A0ABT2Y3P0_9MOLU|nr:hypothetical protein [Paracholeplasma manati]MCV2231349.1 hypothetical protein [Paracholeplasma manati]MDG0888429.1 hypothetical protein [Paracholeplasma manati]
MKDIIEKFLTQFHHSIIVDVNENYVLTILLASNEKKYIQLDSQWRIFQRNQLCLSKENFNNLEQIRSLVTGSKIEKLYINEIHDLNILLVNHTLIQLMVSSTTYENWSINQEIICLPGGELTHLL